MSDELTVEAALKELREMFPGQDCTVEFWTSRQIHIEVWQLGVPLRDNFFDSDSLSDCMAQVRAFKQSHAKERSSK